MPHRRRRFAPAATLALLAALGAAACSDPLTPEEKTQQASAEIVYIGPQLTFYWPATPQISAGARHTCALRRDWVALCWGARYDGRLGDGRPLDDAPWSTTPVQVPGVLFKAISSGAYHTCGLDRDGRGWCWGSNNNGQLGMGGTFDGDTSSPVPVAGGRIWRSISAGGYHTCAIAVDSTAYCWGYNGHGEGGNGQSGITQTYRPEPAPVLGGHKWKSIGAGTFFSCGLTTKGLAMCWGDGYGGSLGTGGDASSSVPVYVYGHRAFASLSVGNAHSCALTYAGEAYCWGENVGSSGTLGTLTSTTGLPLGWAPERVSGGYRFHTVDAGGWQTCGVRRFDAPMDTLPNRTVMCWGSNMHGQLGNGSVGGSSAFPRTVSNLLASNLKAVTSGFGHNCAINQENRAVCWGLGDYGELGTGSTNQNNPLPLYVLGGHSFAP